MSYSGKAPSPCLIQGLSTSDVQDTWTDDRITYSSTNNKAELPSYYKGDWCLRSSIDMEPSTVDRYYSNYKPYDGASRSEHAFVENWEGTSNFCGSETLVCVLNYIEYRLHDAFQFASAPIRDYPGYSTTCEIFV